MKKEKVGLYRFARPFLGTLYKFWFRPNVYGEENIPKDGPIVVVGNHVHIMDQCNVIIKTKRCIHYMAKQEYFDKKYKEGKFSWFFRSVGCIPVDRSKKDTEAVESALDVLKNKWALGLFPEGTRNGLKESKAKEIYDKYSKDFDIEFNEFYEKTRKEKTSQLNYLEELYLNKVIKKKDYINNIYDVDNYLKQLASDKTISEDDYYEHIFLPFKFGAVSMANKSNAYIVPFVITGDYKFRGKNLNIMIGKPFKPGDDLGKANNKLRQEMIKLYKEGLKK